MALTLVRATLSWLAGDRLPLRSLPSEKSYFYCRITLPFSQGNRLSELGHLILPQHDASVEKKKSGHEMGLKFSVYHGSRTPNPCPVAFCFQMKMLCTTEELQQSVNQGSRE